MDRVNFIHTEVGTDIVASFSFDEDTEFGIDGFIMIRTPKFEFLLNPQERRAYINWDEATDIIEIVKEITCKDNEISFTTNLRSYQFDTSKVSTKEMDKFWKTIDKMNFDGTIKIDRKLK